SDVKVIIVHHVGQPILAATALRGGSAPGHHRVVAESTVLHQPRKPPERAACSQDRLPHVHYTGETAMATEGVIAVEGGRVWYRIAGEARTGVPLLTLHGGPGYPHDYLEPLEGLSDERPVIFYDQLGCGRSDRPNDKALWQVDRFVRELAQ